MDLIFKLVEGLIQLARHREETDRKLYENFVDPVVNDFEKVHHNYLETFQNYRKMVDSESAIMDQSHPVLKKIKEDMLFSAQLRAKLKSLENHIEDPVFGGFFWSIDQYMLGGERTKEVLVKGEKYTSFEEDELSDEEDELSNDDDSSLEDYMPLGNAPRMIVIRGLMELVESENSENGKRQKALLLIDRLIVRLQKAYQEVMTEHLKLKKRLLDRRNNV
jgi:hypothetical protein